LDEFEDDDGNPYDWLADKIDEAFANIEQEQSDE
jgi:hypothetical protein